MKCLNPLLTMLWSTSLLCTQVKGIHAICIWSTQNAPYIFTPFTGSRRDTKSSKEMKICTAFIILMLPFSLFLLACETLENCVWHRTFQSLYSVHKTSHVKAWTVIWDTGNYLAIKTYQDIPLGTCSFVFKSRGTYIILTVNVKDKCFI